MNFDLSTLNEQQMKPVLDTEGRILVTAGAGSGKTRLLTHRIAHLVCDLGVKPYNILAITFTNKAANEMRERLAKMMDDAQNLWVFTFHSLCVRILRKFIDKIGYNSNFSIYGEDEKTHFVKKILKEKYPDKEDIYKDVIKHISDAKNEGLSPDDYLAINKFVTDIDLICEVYALYEKQLKMCNALDFDDLLIKAYYLLSNCSEARDYYQEKFHYIHVDEFQDTNTIQYNLIMLLSYKYNNILCVGDEDQSIYGWRGANFKNIFDFSKKEGCKTYKLEQNYRCTKNIITLANKVISLNSERLEKKLWTDNENGEQIKFFKAQSDSDEAEYVVRKMAYFIKSGQYKMSDFAILMRINSLSRSFEEKLVNYNIPHKVYGGFKFYDRKEIKDMLSYLKLLSNHDDLEALNRIINFPKRGIGEGTLSKVTNYALVENKPVFDIILDIDSNQDLPNSVIKRISPFAEQLKCMVNAINNGISVSDLLIYIVKVIRLKEFWSEDNDDNEMRKMNVKELIHSVQEFEKTNDSASLEDYLQSVSLYSDTDDMDQSDECVTLATIHSAKGLEFNTVFLVGMEDGIFPNPRANENQAELEEERRLLYVAITRAKKNLFVTYANSRFRFGKRDYTIPSSFLEEMGYVDKVKLQNDSYSSRYEDSYSHKYFNTYQKSYSKSDSTHNSEEVPLSNASTFFAQKAKKNNDISAFKVGTKVTHRKFGKGEIVALLPGNEGYADVKFDSVGKLTLSLHIAPLEIIE